MKKTVFTILLMVFATLSASAQYPQRDNGKVITQTRSLFVEEQKESHSHGHEWVIKAGAGCQTSIPAVGYDFNVSYHKFLSEKLYVGGHIGASSAAYEAYYLIPSGDEWLSYYYTDKSSLSAYFGPVVGFRPALSENTKLDFNLGVNYQYVFREEEDCKSRVMVNVGAGVWFNRVLVGIGYQMSFLEEVRYQKHLIMLNLGFRF